MLIFYIKKCRIQVGFSCFALLAFCCIFAGMGGGAACFLAVILHEAAHLAVMVLMKAPPSSVTITGLGCRIASDKEMSLSDRKHMMISLAGPGMNWLCWLAAAVFHCGGTSFANASLALGLAHSLPIEPLDGGLALRYFWRAKWGEKKAAQISRVFSAVFLFPLAVLGFLVLLRTRYNFSLLALSLYLMLYLVLGRDDTQV